MGSRLGAFVVQHSYRVKEGCQEDTLALLAQVEQWALDLGVANFEVWRDIDDASHITEVHSFDSWSHFVRVSKKELPRTMQTVYADLDRYIVGGLEAIQTHSWEPTSLS
ncbi:MAG: MFS transporter [Myxococcales bacterium]|nr:MFS transporter [Myxococcales bacterium]